MYTPKPVDTSKVELTDEIMKLNQADGGKRTYILFQQPGSQCECTKEIIKQTASAMHTEENLGFVC